jgi:mono/diheme cytochrome c family protein
MDGTTTTVSLQGLTVSTGYSFQVLAKDGADQWTADGPSLAVTTTSGLEPLTNEEVFEGIKAQCQGCHMTGDTPFMASLENFNSVLVQDPAFVLPGDPDNSEVIRLMEGNGTGAWKAMPALQPDNFKEMSDKGQTSITIEEIRYWILAMDNN